MTYAEVLWDVEALANVLDAKGVRAGDRVALMLPNGLEFPLAWLAIPLLRAVAVPVNVAYREHDLAHVLSHSGASVVVTDAGHRAAGSPLITRNRPSGSPPNPALINRGH